MRLIHRIVLVSGIALFTLRVGASANPPAIPDAPEDAELNRLAYSALQRDEELSDLNLGVRVFRGGMAILWGTAHASDVAKAEALLKKLPGITSVKNTCESTGAADPIVRRVEDAVKSAPIPAASAKADVVASTPLATPLGRNTRTVEKPKLNAVSRREPATRLLDPLPASPPVDYVAIDRVRRSDPRFTRLTLDMRDGRVIIGGGADSPSAAWDFARKLAPLVGDRDIAIGTISRPR